MTRFWWLIGCSAITFVLWAVSVQVRHPIKAELWLAAAVVLLIVAVAERLKT